MPAALGATTQAAVQVAQAAQAVSQHAASLHAAAEVHAAKADAATSQVQSLQATAQVRQWCSEQLDLAQEISRGSYSFLLVFLSAHPLASFVLTLLGRALAWCIRRVWRLMLLLLLLCCTGPLCVR